MWKAQFASRSLEFLKPAGTSRGTLRHKPAWYVRLEDLAGGVGFGEVGFIPGLSLEDRGQDVSAEMDIRLDHICKLISRGEMDPRQALPALPGVRFALDTALVDVEARAALGSVHQGKDAPSVVFPSSFSYGKAGIPINGLIWMGDRASMMQQVKEKLDRGFRVLKMKVGALDFREELRVLGSIREMADEMELEIRLDANGAWKAWEARDKLQQLAAFGIHSIEQPLAAGQTEAMAKLCREGSIDIALDEELIGVHEPEARRALLEAIGPQYIILKPGLIGGLDTADAWVELAAEMGIAWWATSALESNLGLNAIAQWAASKNVSLPQGLGTGQLYANNLPSPLCLRGDELWYGQGNWDLTSLEWK